MQKDTTEPMDTSKVFCPNAMCSARGQREQGTIVIHDRKRQRYRCKTCKQTFNARRGTMFEGLRKPVELIVIVVTLLAYGCPLQAIVHAYDRDCRTVARYQKQVGNHCQKVHEERVMQKHLDLQHVQADAHPGQSLRVLIPWIAMALQIKTRLWLGGVVGDASRI